MGLLNKDPVRRGRIAMKVSCETTGMRLAVAGLALGLVVAGCGKGDEKSSSQTSSSEVSASSSPADSTSAATSTAAAGGGGESSGTPTPVLAPAAYFPLLMKAENIPPAPAGPFAGDPPEDHSKSGSPDVRQTYKSGDNTILSTIEAFPDTTAAAAYAKATADAMGSQIVGGTPQPAPNVAPDAIASIGTSTDGSASMSSLVYSEQNIVVTLIFMGEAGDAVPPDYLDAVGVVQLDAVQQGLPDIGG
ncbi:hypothetical protein BH09ACT8_BH09ACT8_66400 [soil metagenome]